MSNTHWPGKTAANFDFSRLTDPSPLSLEEEEQLIVELLADEKPYVPETLEQMMRRCNIVVISIE